MMEIHGARRFGKLVPLQVAVEDGRVQIRIGDGAWTIAPARIARDFGELVTRAANQAEAARPVDVVAVFDAETADLYRHLLDETLP